MGIRLTGPTTQHLYEYKYLHTFREFTMIHYERHDPDVNARI